MEKRRWYDDKVPTDEALKLLHELDYKTKYKISQEILDVVQSIKEHNRELDEPNLSIGYKRVTGLFYMNNNRRWYDKEENLGHIARMASTLPMEDYGNLMEGICSSLAEIDAQ